MQGYINLSSVDLLPLSSFANATSHLCLATCCAAAPLLLTLVFLYVSTIRKFRSPPCPPPPTEDTTLFLQTPNLSQFPRSELAAIILHSRQNFRSQYNVNLWIYTSQYISYKQHVTAPSIISLHSII